MKVRHMTPGEAAGNWTLARPYPRVIECRRKITPLIIPFPDGTWLETVVWSFRPEELPDADRLAVNMPQAWLS